MIRIIKDKWMRILLFVIIVELLIYAAIYFWIPERYEANATLVVSHTAGDLSSDSYDLDSKLLATYREFATSDAILEDAAKKAGIGLTVKEMRQRVRVVNPKETNLVSIRVWSNVPEISANLANSLSLSISEEVRSSLKINNLHVVDPAVPPKEPTRAHIAVFLSIGALAAFLLSTIVTLLKDYFDDTLKTPEQVSDLFGRPILGQIPHSVTRMRRQS